MQILYVYSNCSYRKYNSLFEKSSFMIAQQAQKYHSLIIDGLSKQKCDIHCISGLPINRSFTKKLIIRSEKEIIDNVKYSYLFSFNFPILRHLFLFFGSFLKVLFSKGKDKAVICDILNISVAYGALVAAKLRKIKAVGIVTDVPGFFTTSTTNDKKKMTEKINSKLMKSFDSYVLLTEEMNKIVNPKQKPYVVIEGQVDCNMKNSTNDLADKNDKRVLMYAGSLMKIYGIKTLCDAFIKTNNKEWELHIYGDGDFTAELKNICKTHTNIKYQGVKLNTEIVKAELSASLLVNPRPTNEEYTKYSFPSKNMEYIVSGTPMLTTKLDGMPKEYYPYVYLIENETVDGLSETLKNLFNKSPEELHKFGSTAKEWALKEKNNIKQAKKILDMIGI